VDVGDDVPAVDLDDGVAPCAEGDVEDGAVLGEVDLFAVEHGVAALGEIRLVGKVDQQAHRVTGDAVLGIVEIESKRVDGEFLGALRALKQNSNQLHPRSMALIPIYSATSQGLEPA